MRTPSTTPTRTMARSPQATETIIQRLRHLYLDPTQGLMYYASMCKQKLLPPREKLTVLLVGNHSAGKSSFINWYIEEHIQAVGVAMETSQITFVTSGKKRETLAGLATLELYPEFKEIQKYCSPNSISTEVCASKAKKFSTITFVDTPGLVDGDVQYPFDIENTISWLSQQVDLVLVFFDPMGQALCKRTLDVVETMYKNKLSTKVHLFMTKADDVPLEKDRQRVLMQITQNLCKRPGLNQYGFDLGTIYLPSQDEKSSKCVNQIDELCHLFEKNINMMVQNTLNGLDTDSQAVTAALQKSISDTELFEVTSSRRKLAFTATIGILLAVQSIAFLIILEAVFGIDLHHVAIFSQTAATASTLALFYLLVGSALVVYILIKLWPGSPPLSPEQIRARRLCLKQLSWIVQERQQLYTEYLQESVTSADSDDEAED